MTRRTITAVFAAALVCALVLLAPAEPASAHAGLVASTPAASSVLDTSPPLIALDFDENIDVPLTSIQLFDQDGTTIDLGGPTEGADQSIVEATVPTIGEGTYAVVWRVSSADGHIVTGAFSFQIGTTSDVDADTLLDTVLNGARADPSVGRGLGVARFAAFFGAALLLGGLFMVYMRPRRHRDRLGRAPLAVDRLAVLGSRQRRQLRVARRQCAGGVGRRRARHLGVGADR